MLAMTDLIAITAVGVAIAAGAAVAVPDLDPVDAVAPVIDPGDVIVPGIARGTAPGIAGAPDLHARSRGIRKDRAPDLPTLIPGEDAILAAPIALMTKRGSRFNSNRRCFELISVHI